MNRYDHFSKQQKVKGSSNFPKEDHLAIIEFRSETNNDPCGSSTINYSIYSWFKMEDKESWIYVIEDYMGMHNSSKVDFIALNNGKVVKPSIKLEL